MEENPIRLKKRNHDWISPCLAGLMLLAPFLGGCTRRWSQGIVLLLMGILVAARPARSFGSKRLLLLFSTLLAVAGTAFLPASWFYHSNWRQTLVGGLGIPLAGMVSPQPWLSMDCIILLLAGILWISWLQAQSWSANEHRRMFKLFAAGTALFAGVALVVYFTHLTIPFWLTRERMFGPFPNRNQTANFFALSAILTASLVYDSALSKKVIAFGWTMGLVLIGTALVVNYSRAGIIVFFAGLVLWLGLMVAQTPSTKWIAAGASFLLATVSAFLFFGGSTLDRFHENAGILGYRSLVFKDAFRLIRNSPWCGIGLGNIEGLFAIFRSASASQSRIIHPESDWLWLWSEMGWIAVVLVMGAILLLVKEVFPLKRGTNRSLRAAALAAVTASVLHGLVDVSGHRLGSMLPALFLFGLALPPRKTWKPDPRAPLIFRIAGVSLVGVGSLWLSASMTNRPLPGKIAADIAKAGARKLMETGNFTAAIPAATRALEWIPLDWELYYARGAARTILGEHSTALADFRRANTLETSSELMPLEEGKMWISRDTGFALSAWKEALRRSPSDEAVMFYAQMLRGANRNELLLNRLHDLASGNARLEADYLGFAPEGEFEKTLETILKIDPELSSLTAPEQASLFSLWVEHGDALRFMERLEKIPSWQKNGWLAAAKYYAQQKQYDLACQTCRRYAKIPALPKLSAAGTEQTFLRRILIQPSDFSAGYALFEIQMKTGREDDALATLNRMEAIADCPPYVHYLSAELWIKRGDWQKAWEALAAYGSGEETLIRHDRR